MLPSSLLQHLTGCQFLSFVTYDNNTVCRLLLTTAHIFVCMFSFVGDDVESQVMYLAAV